ncbi:S-formylglutathione hydrolase [Thermocoleostomius sinensis]|uniref:S-formylglutathione hydrolase n=1 Tax=Thermocoleostomius sinensis A174 TaxID=2016057 RepID=A0A9E8ZNU8_9CYAN|nr:S-formylglutathione hydrolase [Thermocoleostomius sinensis]WAL62006.1 S-formylglutathione hydrolase [Thermocoleostomius sinensis A174]
MSDALTVINQYACFNGTVGFYRHASQVCNCEMRFAVFVPPQAKQASVPVLYYLSGLTCTEENFTTKAGAQRYAAEYGLMLVAPDTSPRGEDVPDAEDAWDFGKGAGFYVDATESPWNQHYHMYSYVVDELPTLIHANFPVQPDRTGIFGHSMGGHGALICGLKHPDRYRSISAFAPISAPSQCQWGQKAFSGYLGTDRAAWQDYDATELIKRGARIERAILIDQGTEDTFLAQQQLLPEVFAAACEQAGQPVTLRMQPGYDHSYYFIATFIGDHIQHHAAALT